jgi:TPR repeat protein
MTPYDRRARLYLASILLCARISTSASAAPPHVPDGLAAYNAGDFATALREASGAAQAGDKSAAVLLGGAIDFAQAAAWAQRAAAQQDANGFSILRNLYTRGHGVPQNFVEAAKWFVKGAEAGNAVSQNNLGHFYAHGLGVARDDQKAVFWLKKAVANGFDAALNNLAGMYRLGRGLPKDDRKAAELALQAA